MAQIDLGRHSDNYAEHRPGFPGSFYRRLDGFARIEGSRCLDLATGPGTIALELAPEALSSDPLFSERGCWGACPELFGRLAVALENHWKLSRHVDGRVTPRLRPAAWREPLGSLPTLAGRREEALRVL